MFRLGKILIIAMTIVGVSLYVGFSEGTVSMSSCSDSKFIHRIERMQGSLIEMGEDMDSLKEICAQKKPIEKEVSPEKKDTVVLLSDSMNLRRLEYEFEALVKEFAGVMDYAQQGITRPPTFTDSLLPESFFRDIVGVAFHPLGEKTSKE